MDIGCVVMASGNARRFGENKLMASIGGKPLIRRTLEAVPPDRFHTVAVVTQYPEAAAMAEEFCFLPVWNAHPEWGVSYTIRLGLDALDGCGAAMFLVSDQPLLRRETVAAAADLYRNHPDRLIGVAHQGVRGNPCIFPAKFFPALRALRGGQGGGTVIRQHRGDLLLLEVPACELADIDTWQDLHALEAQQARICSVTADLPLNSTHIEDTAG